MTNLNGHERTEVDPTTSRRLEKKSPFADNLVERALLATLWGHPSTLSIARRRLKSEDFHRPMHARMFSAMLALADRGAPFNATLLGIEIGHDIAVHLLHEMEQAQASEEAVTEYIARVVDLARRRRTISAIASASEQLEQGVHPSEVWAILDDAAQEARPPAASIEPLGVVIEQMMTRWDQPETVTRTRLWQLDTLLSGGLRNGDLLGLAGAAAAGKSALVGQIALDAAKDGAVVVYASVEMSAAEVLARWLALEAFRAVPQGIQNAWGLSYADILYGRAWRGEDSRGRPLVSQRVRDEVLTRLEAARSVLNAVSDRLFATQIEPGSTVDRLAALVRGARERAPERHTLLVIDPVQRLFASERHGRKGRAAEAINANETERVSAVAQELKHLADHEELSVVFTSDTTKAAAMGAMSSASSLRGSYQLNHLATVVLGLHSAKDAESVRRLLDGEDKKCREAIAEELTVDEIQRRSEPAWWSSRTDIASLGRAVAVLECSKNRRGAPQAIALGFVRGATAFVEGEDTDTTVKPNDPPPTTNEQSTRRTRSSRPTQHLDE
jgi:replicative DNA helicase